MTNGEQESPGVRELRHVVVVMLENRSFDHLLGYLDHPDRRFDGIGAGRTNPWDPDDVGTGQVPAVRKWSPRWRVDPDHSHDAVMSQIRLDAAGVARNDGFVASYEHKATGTGPGPEKAARLRRRVRGAAAATVGAGAMALLARAPVVSAILGAGGVGAWVVGDRLTRPDRYDGDGERIMWCWDPGNVKALGTLALEFGLCTRWFSSVPGETWPNRQFAHAATSAGSHDIEAKLYFDRTIFEVLEKDGHDWGIYFDGPPQVLCYADLWRRSDRLRRWHSMQDLFHHIESSSLPTYAFVEPNHGFIGRSYSQHPREQPPHAPRLPSSGPVRGGRLRSTPPQPGAVRADAPRHHVGRARWLVRPRGPHADNPTRPPQPRVRLPHLGRAGSDPAHLSVDRQAHDR